MIQKVSLKESAMAPSFILRYIYNLLYEGIKLYKEDNNMEMRSLENLVMEVQETQKFVKSIAKSQKAMANMQYLDKLKEAGLIDQVIYEDNLVKIGEVLLDFNF